MVTRNEPPRRADVPAVSGDPAQPAADGSKVRLPRAEIGRRLAALRDSTGVPIEDLAAAAGMSVAEYREVEAGEPAVDRLDVDGLWALSEALGTTPRRLLDGLGRPRRWRSLTSRLAGRRRSLGARLCRVVRRGPSGRRRDR